MGGGAVQASGALPQHLMNQDRQVGTRRDRPTRFALAPDGPASPEVDRHEIGGGGPVQASGPIPQHLRSQVQRGWRGSDAPSGAYRGTSFIRNVSEMSVQRRLLSLTARHALLTTGVPRSEETPTPLGPPYSPRHSPSVGS